MKSRCRTKITYSPLNLPLMDFHSPKQNVYSYNFSGFDERWINIGNRNFIEFANLSPGEYSLKLKGANSRGVWSASGTGIDIIITPPFWATWWFRLLILIVVSSTLYALYRARVNTLLHVERTRNRIARDLHDEVSATLSSTLFFAHAIQNREEGKTAKESRASPQADHCIDGCRAVEDA